MPGGHSTTMIGKDMSYLDNMVKVIKENSFWYKLIVENMIEKNETIVFAKSHCVFSVMAT